MEQYTKAVMQHFMKPKNLGRIEKADAMGKLENERCGDMMIIYLKIGKRKGKGQKKEEEFIKDIKFQTLGCPAAIAASDVLCELVKGKSLEEAGKINEAGITKELGGLPLIKVHCSVLGAKTLKNAIDNYRKNKESKK